MSLHRARRTPSRSSRSLEARGKANYKRGSRDAARVVTSAHTVRASTSPKLRRGNPLLQQRGRIVAEADERIHRETSVVVAYFQHSEREMKLTVALKLLPSESQCETLKATLRRVNTACNYVSEVAWETRTFGKYALQKGIYKGVRERFDLTAQVVIRLLAKVADAYRLDKRTKRTFRPLGAIAYDDRILRWGEDIVSIWTVEGRQHIPFVCDERTRPLLGHRRGESDLVYREGKWYLLATVEVEEPPPGTPEDWLGVDLGVKNIAADSEGEIYTGGHLRGLRHRYQRVRSRLQSKGTKSSRRLARKRRRREHRMARDANHHISKRIVEKAQRTKSGIALEDLKGIRGRVRARRSQRSALHSWSFHQLREFICYRARLAGVPVAFVDPRNTSRTCPGCGHCDKRNRPNRDAFRCTACGFAGPADSIAATNIGRRAHVMVPNAAGACA
jgi:putative transposase